MPSPTKTLHHEKPYLKSGTLFKLPALKIQLQCNSYSPAPGIAGAF